LNGNVAIDKLFSQWHGYWIDRELPRDRVDRIFDRLVAAYTHPDRHYHNLQHIESVLATVARFDCQLPLAVNLAAWFHDVIYDPRARDNELQSAIVARELLSDLKLSSQLLDRIEQLILATQGHRIDPQDFDLCIFLDADLAILGADPQTYRDYAAAIRREYSWVPKAEYRSGRSRVLTEFLQRDRLYHTELLFTELEATARSNLQHEIDRLMGI
jgi:predicted metal-dependent HD superfamily phosphohydrolase